MRYVNLHHHSTFSFGDGFGTPAQHVVRAVELGYGAITLTEHGSTSSHFQLEKAALKAGIKPIFGVEAYTGPVGVQQCDCDGEKTKRELGCSECEGMGTICYGDTCPECNGTGVVTEWETCERCKGTGEIDLRTQFKHHLTILAADGDGYRNLNRIVTQSFRDFYYHPTVSGVCLAENSDGLIVLSGCSGSQLACALLGGKGTPEHIDAPDLKSAAAVIRKFQRLLGDRYFLEIQPFWELPRTKAMNESYAELSARLGVPMVVTCDVHYPKPEDAEMQAVLHAVHRGKASVDDAMREWNYDVLLTLPDSEDDLRSRLEKTGLTSREALSAIDMAAKVADRCNVTLPKAERLRYPISEQDLKPWT